MVRNMKMMKFAVLPVLVAALVGCQSTTVNKDVINNSQFVVDDAVLTKYSSSVVVDDLEGRFYYTDTDSKDWIVGTAYSKIRFTYHPDASSNYIIADVRTMQPKWVHADSVSIYLGKDKIIDKWTSGRYTDTSIVPNGSGSDVYTHEYFSVRLPISDAKRLAESDKSKITLRFYGEAGYVDEKIHPFATMDGLKSVVALAMATKPKA